MVLHSGSKLEKNETNDADTFIIHDTAVCLYIFVSTALYTLKYKWVYAYLGWSIAQFLLFFYTIKYKLSTCSQKPAFFCHRYVNSILIQLHY